MWPSIFIYSWLQSHTLTHTDTQTCTHRNNNNSVNSLQICTDTHTLCALANGAGGGHGRGGGVSPPLVCIDINLRCDSFFEGGEKRCTVGFNLAQFLVCRLLYR